MVDPSTAAWLMERVPWIGPWLVGLMVLCVIVSVASNWPLLKYGTRHWRVTRKWADRKWKRKTGDDR